MTVQTDLITDSNNIDQTEVSSITDISDDDVSSDVSDELVSDETDVEETVVTDVEEETVVTDDISVTEEDRYTFVEFLELDFTKDLKEFFTHYIVETPDGFFQIFQSMTYGEMLISFLLFTLIVLYVLRWIYDVLF